MRYILMEEGRRAISDREIHYHCTCIYKPKDFQSWIIWWFKLRYLLSLWKEECRICLCNWQKCICNYFRMNSFAIFSELAGTVKALCHSELCGILNCYCKWRWVFWSYDSALKGEFVKKWMYCCFKWWSVF